MTLSPAILTAAICCATLLSAQDASPQPAPAGALTLAQVIETALAHHPTIEAAQAAVDSARGRTEQSGAARLPQVSANGEYTYMSLRPKIQFGPNAFYTTIQDSYNASVSVRQLLSDFGRTDSIVELARAGEISARDALEQAQSQLGYQTIQAFYGVLLLRQSVGVCDDEIRSLEEALRISEKKFEGGTATKFDVLTTQVHLANARDSRTDTLAALKKQEAAVREVLGLGPSDPVVLSGGFEVDASTPDLSPAIAEGLRNRPEMKLARDSAKSAGLKLDAADRENRPTLSAQANGGVEDQQLPALYNSRSYVDAGLSVSVPIFTGNLITGERIEARADLRAAKARIDALNRSIVTEVSDSLSDLDAARARLTNADTVVAQAQEALALAKTRYANGVITNFELLDAQSSARAAEQARLQARYDCVLTRQALARAEGRPPAP